MCVVVRRCHWIVDLGPSQMEPSVYAVGLALHGQTSGSDPSNKRQAPGADKRAWLAPPGFRAMQLRLGRMDSAACTGTRMSLTRKTER